MRSLASSLKNSRSSLFTIHNSHLMIMIRMVILSLYLLTIILLFLLPDARASWGGDKHQHHHKPLHPDPGAGSAACWPLSCCWTITRMITMYSDSDTTSSIDSYDSIVAIILKPQLWSLLPPAKTSVAITPNHTAILVTTSDNKCYQWRRQLWFTCCCYPLITATSMIIIAATTAATISVFLYHTSYSC